MILLVTEEDPFRFFGARALRSKGYKVVEAQTGEAAIEMLRGASFDLLITDMVMPKVGGDEVIKAARSGDLICRSFAYLDTRRNRPHEKPSRWITWIFSLNSSV